MDADSDKLRLVNKSKDFKPEPEWTDGTADS